MRYSLASICLAAFALATPAFAQEANPDLRIRADFRTPDDGTWPDNQSVGHAEFRIRSRFGQVYYGGVIRQDEYKFSVQVDFSEASDMATEFPGSIYDTDYDVYINNAFVGRVDMNASQLGFGELRYDSRHAKLPDLPLPAGFPSPVNVGDTVRVFAAAASLPAIGSPLPSGSPLFESDLVEEFMRGDVNQDGEVDDMDFVVLAANYDPYLVLGPHVGPMNGDFSGDNLSTLADYQVMAQNWTGDGDVPPEPQPAAIPCPTITNQPQRASVCPSAGGATFSVNATGVGALSYRWQVEASGGAWIDVGTGPVALSCGTAFAGGALTSEFSLTLQGCTAARVRVIVSNGCGGTTSNPATLRIGPAGDANADLVVGIADLARLIQNWSFTSPAALLAADLDDSGSVGLSDVSVVISNWTGVCP